MKLELACGDRPTLGYEHNDLYPFTHIEHVGEPRLLDLPSGSVEEVLALAFIEHLTYEHALDTFRNIRRMLQPHGNFYFDVPNYPIWANYYLDNLACNPTPVPIDHIRKTLFGWQRWPGDEHKYGWDQAHLTEALNLTGYSHIQYSVQPFIVRAYRRRFFNPEDAHLYVVATK